MLSILLFTGAALAASPGDAERWESVGPFGGPAGFVSIDRANPNRLIASSRNGNVFISTTAGRKWTALPFPRTRGAMIETLKIDPAEPRHFLAGVADETGQYAGLYESRDAGGTWKRELEGESVFSLAFYPGAPATFAAGTRSGVSIFEDGAWRKTSEGPSPVMSLAFDPADSKRIYAGTTHLPWRTLDGGGSWEVIHEGMLDDSDVFSIHVDERDPNRVYASACSGIYASSSKGDEWKRAQGIPGTDRRTHVITSDPEYSHLLLAGTTAGLWKSADAGATWRKLNENVIRSLEYNPRDSRVLYMATADRGLMKSMTAGLIFIEINEGFVGRPVERFVVAGKSLAAMVLSRDGEMNVLKSTDSGESWKNSDLGLRGLTDLAGVGAELAAITSAGVFRSVDAGAKWAKLKLPEAAGQPYEVFAAKRSIAVRTGKGFWLSTDAGTRWTPISQPEIGRVFGIGPHSRDPNVIFSATSEGLFKSTDRGKSWVRVSGGLPGGFFYTVTSNPERPEEWFAAQMGRVFRSMDNGESWTELPGVVETASIRRLAVFGQRIFALTEGQGLFRRAFLQ